MEIVQCLSVISISWLIYVVEQSITESTIDQQTLDNPLDLFYYLFCPRNSILIVEFYSLCRTLFRNER